MTDVRDALVALLDDWAARPTYGTGADYLTAVATLIEAGEVDRARGSDLAMLGGRYVAGEVDRGALIAELDRYLAR